MIQAHVLRDKLQRSFGLFDDLIQVLLEKHLQLGLAGLPSNTIGQQFWCVIGARQSYLKAINAGNWQGFTCDLDLQNAKVRTAVQEHLKQSRAAFTAAIEGLTTLTSNQQSLLLDLIEHEAQHHGQLIRYLYGNKITIPASWKERYHLERSRYSHNYGKPLIMPLPA